MTTEPRRVPVFVERLLLLVGAPLVFLLFAEAAIAVLGIDTDVARNENAQIALPVWLLADEVWVADRQNKLERSGGEPISAADVAWLYHFEEARWIGYKMKPGVDVDAVNPFNAVEVAKNVTFRLASNSSGFRDRPFAAKKPGVTRIVTLGDSSTFGWGAAPEHTYQRLLEERLNAIGPGRFEVLNLGIPGHNTRHGLGILRHHALQLDPDLLIVAYGANDPRWVPAATDTVLSADDTFMGGLRFTLLKLRTYRLLRRLVFTLADPLQDEPEADADAATEPTAATSPEERELVRAVPLEDFENNLREFATIGQDVDAGAIFVSVCTSERPYAAAVRNVAAEIGIDALDVRDVFSAKIDALEAGTLYPEQVDKYRTLYGDLFNQRRAYAVTSDGCHPHWVGHSLIADELVPLVRSALGHPAIATEPGELP